MIPQPLAEKPRPRDRWKHGSVPVLGLIGGIGGGKSSVARLLAARGAAVIDADAVGHELLEEPAIAGRVVARFGPVIQSSSGAGGARIDRRALGAIVFGDRAALRDLEAILHPAMRERFRGLIGELARDRGRPCIVLDAAVLLEAGWDELCDRIAWVDAPPAERARRVRESRGWSAETLAAREAAQWPAEEKRRRADWVIDNDADPAGLDHEVDGLLGRIAVDVPRST